MKAFALTNPNVFMPRQITVSVWRIDGRRASFLSETTWPRQEDGEERHPTPPDRTYPDREMFPGSIMQFVQANALLFYQGDD